jgi:hypothetical protein
MLQRSRADRLPRTDHPAVNWDKTIVVQSRQQRLTRVCVTCPECKVERWAHPGPTAARIRQDRFTGKCLACSGNARKRVWVTLGPGRKIDPAKGYVRLTLDAIPADEVELYNATRGKAPFVMEHRMVMARVLGRPLLTNELVDHMDGIKTNNDPSNLRLYIRGRNMPGETSGYGTYYHEWQMALARIRDLESLAR